MVAMIFINIDEFCVEIDGFCVRNDEFCVESDELRVRNDDLNAKFQVSLTVLGATRPAWVSQNAGARRREGCAKE